MIFGILIFSSIGILFDLGPHRVQAASKGVVDIDQNVAESAPLAGPPEAGLKQLYLNPPLALSDRVDKAVLRLASGSNKGLPKVAPACEVGRRSQLFYYPSFSTPLLYEPYIMHITQKSLVFHPTSMTESEGTKGKENSQESPANDEFIVTEELKQVPLWRIRTPVVTHPNLASCFTLRFLGDANNFNFCANTPSERDLWVNDVTKAVFCLHSGRYVTELNLATGTAAKIPVVSDRDVRWAARLRSEMGAAVAVAEGKGDAGLEELEKAEGASTEQKTPSTTTPPPVPEKIEIEIDDVMDHPVVSLDGEPLKQEEIP